jgi:spermidine/putrescine transport system permease protein
MLLKLHAGLVFLFLYAPIVILVIFSFDQDKRAIVWQGFTVDWYVKLWHNDQIRDAIVNSLIVSGATTAIATIIGTLAGMALGRYRFRGKTATQGLLYLPIIIPEIVVGVALVTFFGVTGFELGLWTVIIAHVVFSVSYVAIVVRARMAGMDRSLLEAAADLGPGRRGVSGA